MQTAIQYELETGLTSITRTDRLHGCSSIEGIVIVGSSAVGKSVIVHAIRNSRCLARSDVSVPRRYITRPKRRGDTAVENCHVSEAEFLRKVKSGHIGLRWTRKMEGDREERYGFEITKNMCFPVFSGNNAFYNNRDSVQPALLRGNLLVVGVYAPDRVREDRLYSRSPDLFRNYPDEVEYRLGDSSENIFDHVDYVVHNYGDYEGVATAEIAKFVSRIATMNSQNTLIYQ